MPDQSPNTAPRRLASVKALPGGKLEVKFNDGTNGIVEMLDFVMSNEAEEFNVLRDPAVFNKVYLVDGLATWPGDVDLSSDVMYDEIKQKGKWVL